MTRVRTMLLLSSFLIPLAGCQDGPLIAAVERLRNACAGVDPACGKGPSPRDTVEEAAGLLGQIKGMCAGLDTGSVACRDKLVDLAGVMGQVGKLAGGWESMKSYGYKAKSMDKIQVTTSVTRYWIGAKDNKGGIYVSQNNSNLVCAAADIVPPGTNVGDFLDVRTGGTPGETREDLLCEKITPGFPLCLGTYTSMCVSTGWHEKDHWVMNTKADEACIRSFEWRSHDEAKLEQFRSQLKSYITGLALQLETCSLRPTGLDSQMLLECGSPDAAVFQDELRRM